MPRYSETVMEHVHDPQHRGGLVHATHTGTVGRPGQGPFFVLQLRVEDQQILEAAFQCNACGVTIACGSLLCEWLTGRTLTDAGSLTLQQLLDLADGLPADKHHCAATAIDALNSTLT